MRLNAARAADSPGRRYNVRMTSTLPPTTAAINLRRLLQVRAVAIAGLFVTLAFAVMRLRLNLPVGMLLAIQ